MSLMRKYHFTLSGAETCEDDSRFTHRAVIEEVQQRDEESPPVLPVPPDHGEEVSAERRVRLVLPETSDDGLTGRLDGLLQVV